jgi:hypothetical protein
MGHTGRANKLSGKKSCPLALRGSDREGGEKLNESTTGIELEGCDGIAPAAAEAWS